MTIRERLDQVREEIAAACAEAGRSPDEVVLVAVTKTHPPERIREAHAAGVCAVGENRAQELLAKRPLLADLDLEWHMIGHLQTNKAKAVAPQTALLHSVDRVDLIRAIEKLALPHRLDVLLQVNTTGEATKSGVEPAELPALADAARRSPALRLRGLMTIGPLGGTELENRRAFAALRAHRDQLAAAHRDLELTVLSMGMSGDFREAILEGSTLVRIGSRIFGEREAG